MRTRQFKDFALAKTLLVLIFVLLSYALLPCITISAEMEEDAQNKGLKEPLTVEVVLERMYLDGEISQEVLEEEILSMEDFWAKYEDWQLIDMDEKKVVFREYLDDISPLLKTNGYFGITEDGILTIYNGKPNKAKIIHSFFQLDVGKLESTKHERLKKGIPIKNKDRYVEVLETFKSYTVQEKQPN